MPLKKSRILGSMKLPPVIMKRMLSPNRFSRTSRKARREKASPMAPGSLRRRSMAF